MSNSQKYKLIHFFGTAWLLINAGLLLVFGMIQSGQSWWIILSLSGYSAVFLFVLVSLYLFAIYRGVVRDQKTNYEHPLTNSNYYLAIYDFYPFIGSLSGIIAARGITNVSDFILIVAGGCFWSTFIMWIVIDPIIGTIEIFLPSVRKHRLVRLKKQSQKKRQENSYLQQMLKEIEYHNHLKYHQWEKVLEPSAQTLVRLASTKMYQPETQLRIVDVGLSAWRIGGLEGMNKLFDMTRKRFTNMTNSQEYQEFISNCWDGIGQWTSNQLYAHKDSPIVREKRKLSLR